MNTTEISILEHIEQIYTKTRNCKLEGDYQKDIKDNTQPICDWLDINENEAIVIAMAFGLSIQNDRVHAEQFAKHFDCDIFKIFYFQAAINSLKEKFLLDESTRVSTTSCTMNDRLTKAILDNDLTFRGELKFDTPMETLESFETIYKKLTCNEMDQSLHKKLTKNYLNRAQKFELFKWISNLELSWRNQTFLLTIIWDYILGVDEFEVKRIIKQYLEQEFNRMDMMQQLKSEMSDLNLKNLVETVKTDYTDDLVVKLTDTVINRIKSEGIDVDIYRAKSTNKQNLILAEKIFKKELYYNQRETSQIENLHKILEETKLKTIQNNLSAKGLPIGITILLYGAPGTGKTETVFQLAKWTNRNVLKIDISSTKSAWFGESQKLTKRIFKDYQNLCESENQKPILLFNEADGIIGKRKDAGSTSVADTENAIQNIILEELENFSGIFIATTNLVTNMDSAFERRFLYKIKFENPSLENKQKIWMNKIDFIADKDAYCLAKEFNFSGGQIDNIARKIQMHEIIENARPSFEEIVSYCDHELWDRDERKKVGF